ncbi:MAG: hypothetical protein QXI58_02200 [Candidatus Micrarchaeia archaeon]
MYGEEFGNVWVESGFPWQIISIILVSISFAFSAIAYMLYKIFGTEGLRRFANSEFLAALSTLIIVASIVVFISILEEKVVNLAIETAKVSNPSIAAELNKLPKEMKTVFSYPLTYLEDVINCARVTWARIVCADILVDMGIGQKGLAAGPLLGIRNSLYEANSSVSYLLFLLYLQYHLLIFSQQTMLTIFLPIGILCRIFPLTRGIGNVFIAVAIGFYFVLPLSYYLVLGGLYAPDIETKCAFRAAEINYNWECAKIFAGSAALSFLPSLAAEWGKAQFPGVFSSDIARIGGVAAASVPALLYFRDEVVSIIAELNMFAIIYPFAAVAITLTFIRSFAILLGTRAEDLVQGILKLI